MMCCGQCFQDNGLKKTISSELSGENADCPTCGSKNVAIVDASVLRDKFEFLIGIYTEDRNGQTLTEWLREDWSLFEGGPLDIANANALLAEILDDGEIVRKKFIPSPQWQSDKALVWQLSLIHI